MLDLKEKYGELKEDAGTIKNNINKLSVILENEKASVLELQKEIQNSYDLLMEKIAASNRKEEEIKLKQDELENLRKELVEKDIENKTLTQNIKTLTKDNKELQEKLYQKEQDELKFKILTNETSINIENLKKKMDEQNEKIQQYKAEIEGLKGEIEKQKKIDIISIPLDIDSDQKLTVNNINSLEEEIEKKEQKIYIDLLKESKLNINNIQEFILNRSKSLDDPEELSTNDWKKILNFGVSYKILTNREIQQLKQISLMLGNSGYKSERNEILNKVKENGFEISLYKAEDWEKVLEFLVATKGITKEVKDGFEGIFKKYKKKKMFKLEQLTFILPYFEKYKENIKKIEIESKDDFLEKEITLQQIMENITEPIKKETDKNISSAELSNENIEDLNPKTLTVKSYESITNLIMNKLKRLEDMRVFTKEEWKNILDFGIQYDLFKSKGRLEAERVEGYKRNGGKWNQKLLEMGKRTYKVVEKNGYNASIFDFYEWNKVMNHLKDSKIVTTNIIHEFYNISNESEETGFFSLEQLKFISPYLDKFKELINNKEEMEDTSSLDEMSIDMDEKESGEVEGNKFEEFKESKYDLSKMQNRTLRALKLFSSKNWENLAIWSDNRLLIENEDIEVLNSLINGKPLEEFKELELIGLIELYDYLVEEGFNSKDFNLEEEEKYNTTFKELKSFDMEDWRKLYDWSDKKLLIQHEDHKLLAPLVNGNSIGNMEESDLINLSNLYKRLLEKGFEKKSTISEEKEIEVLEEVNPVSEDELLEEVRNFKSKDWIDMLDWAKNNKKLRTQDYNILSNLAFKSIDKGLNENEVVLGLEVYFIAKSEGFQIVKEKDVDEFLMRFVDESVEEECTQEKEQIKKIINFNDLINKGLESGFIEYILLEQINYDKEIEINDHFEAIEELEDRGIVIKY